MADIVLATLNARWSHASLGLRCLYANLGPLQSRAAIEEFTVAAPLEPVVERILAHEVQRERAEAASLDAISRRQSIAQDLEALLERLQLVF